MSRFTAMASPGMSLPCRGAGIAVKRKRAPSSGNLGTKLGSIGARAERCAPTRTPGFGETHDGEILLGHRGGYGLCISLSSRGPWLIRQSLSLAYGWGGGGEPKRR